MTHQRTSNPQPDQHGYTVRRAAGPLRTSAAERLIESSGRQGPRAAREFIRTAKHHGISLDNMWCSVDSRAQPAGENTARTTCLAMPGEGRTTMLFTSAPDESRIGELARVIQTACNAAQPGTLAQALLEPSEQRARRAFIEAGFIDVGTLEYLQRPRPNAAEAKGWALDGGDLGVGVTMSNAPTSADDALEHALSRSYEGTLDCPELTGLRELRDIIASHRATGEFDPDLWWIIEKDADPLGAVLINPNPAQSADELVYMGLAPELRGKGIAKRALRHALSQLVHRDESIVTCAVDARNEPARTLYIKHGFTSVQRRIALVKQAH